ncbi:MAG: hypothetical protein SLAVMIC_00290 [uncultured marine phage]|uniref:Uncharacterized protein n=1 Tax=uncultured marine phage TaxID=707152 RepID=A0A8D9C8N9_9VIRU|nr:MAG: hypothetical protein SLAVMIC_00290 [uncultured marine phage]
MENEKDKDKDKIREERIDHLLGKIEKTDKDKEKDALRLEKSEFICTNKWCKAKYFIERFKYYENHVTTCDKCRSFDNELSGGTTFTKKEYHGNRHDNMPHQVDFKFSDYVKGKWGKFWGK